MLAEYFWSLVGFAIYVPCWVLYRSLHLLDLSSGRSVLAIAHAGAGVVVFLWGIALLSGERGRDEVGWFALAVATAFSLSILRYLFGTNPGPRPPWCGLVWRWRRMIGLASYLIDEHWTSECLHVDRIARSGGAVFAPEKEIVTDGTWWVTPQDIARARQSFARLREEYEDVTGLRGGNLSRCFVGLFSKYEHYSAYLTTHSDRSNRSLPNGSFFDGRFQRAICYVDPLSSWEESLWLLRHEVTHALQAAEKNAFRENWLLEGLAGYLEYDPLEDDADPAGGAEGEYSPRTLRRLAQCGQALSFEQLRSVDSRSLGYASWYGSGIDGPVLTTSFYCQSKHVVFFLRHNIDDGKSKFRSLIEKLSAGASFEVGLRSGYEMSVESLESAFFEWVLAAPARAKPADSEVEDHDEDLQQRLQRILRPGISDDERAFFLRRDAFRIGAPALELAKRYAAGKPSSLQVAGRWVLFLEELAFDNGSPSGKSSQAPAGGNES